MRGLTKPPSGWPRSELCNNYLNSGVSLQRRPFCVSRFTSQIMELPSENQPGIFHEEPSPELFIRFASAGRWLRILGSIGLIAAAICLPASIMNHDFIEVLLGIIGSLVGGYFSLQMVLFGTKAIAARQKGSMMELSSSARHLSNAFRVLGIVVLAVLLLIVCLVCYGIFFGGFHR